MMKPFVSYVEIRPAPFIATSLDMYLCPTVRDKPVSVCCVAFVSVISFHRPFVPINIKSLYDVGVTLHQINTLIFDLYSSVS